jgi:hypothetical protein
MIIDRFFKKQQIGPPGYMTRWFLLVLGPLVEVYLHRIDSADAGRDSHDHPWLLNISVLLKGGYIEGQYKQGFCIDRFPCPRVAIRFGRSEHRFASVEPGTFTLFIGLVRWRAWGFYKPNGAFIPNDIYKGPEE